MTGREELAIDVCGISKCYHVYEKPSDRLKQALYPRMKRVLHSSERKYFRDFWALKDVSFSVRPGEAVGIIGRNGSGKSTLLQLICGTLAPTAGTIETTGRIAALLELGSGFNPEFSGRENIYMNGAVLGLSGQEIANRYDRIVEFSEIEEFIDQPVKTYSSGMYMRLAFAVQAHIDASIVIIDEALTVGDVFFRQKCYARLDKLRKDGAAILLVSHSMPDIEQYCERAVLLDRGVVKFIGSAPEAAKHYYLLNQPGAGEKSPRVVPAVSSRTLSLGNTVGERPPLEAFLDISGRSQIGNGQASCIGVAICNEYGEARNHFKQGDRAVFYYEFELHHDVEAPVCGMVIRNDRGIIVHGKNSLQFGDDIPLNLVGGCRILCRQEIIMDLGLGDYVFEIGLASVSVHDWENRESISYEDLSSREFRICHIADAGSFSVGLAIRNSVSVLTHHGIANLQSKLKITTFS